MVSTRSGRSIGATDLANEVQSGRTGLLHEETIEEEHFGIVDTTKGVDQSEDKVLASGVSDHMSASPGVKLLSPRVKLLSPRANQERRVSDVKERSTSPDVKSKASKLLDEIANMPLGDEGNYTSTPTQEDQAADFAPSEAHLLADYLGVAPLACSSGGEKKRTGRSASGSWLSVLLTSGVFLAMAAGSWSVLCGSASGLQLLPSDSPIATAAAPTCAHISSKTAAVWAQLQHVANSVVEASQETVTYYNARFQDLSSRVFQSTAPESFSPVYEEYPLTFRTWLPVTTFSQLLPSGQGWEELLQDFYQTAASQATGKDKAASAVLTCQHFAVCSAASAAIKTSLYRTTPGCFMEVQLGNYAKTGLAGNLELDLAHQLGACPNSIIILRESERAPPAVVHVLNKLTAEGGRMQMGGDGEDAHAVPTSGAVMLLMYETGTAPPASAEGAEAYDKEIGDQVQGDMESYIGDVDSAVLAHNFRIQIDFVAPLK